MCGTYFVNVQMFKKFKFKFSKAMCCYSVIAMAFAQSQKFGCSNHAFSGSPGPTMIACMQAFSSISLKMNCCSNKNTKIILSLLKITKLLSMNLYMYVCQYLLFNKSFPHCCL